MAKKLIVSALVLNLCFLLGVLAGATIRVTSGKTQPQKSQVKTISGAPLTATDFADKSGVHILADYSDAGSSMIDVPLSRIPQAAAWEEKRRSAALLVSPRGALSLVGGYRWGQFQALGSVRLHVASPLSFRDYDVSVGGGLLW